MTCGATTGDSFTNTEGRPLWPWTFSTRDLDRVLKVAGIMQPVTLYSLRQFVEQSVEAVVETLATLAREVGPDYLYHEYWDMDLD